jgi:hypothetical protein
MPLGTPGGSANNQNLVDYIVEQGVTNGVYWRKWNSGLAECWGEQSFTVALDRAAGAFYIPQNPLTISFPTSLFTSIQDCSLSRITSENIYATTFFVAGVSPTGYSFNPARTSTTATATYVIGFRAVGRWLL